MLNVLVVRAGWGVAGVHDVGVNCDGIYLGDVGGVGVGVDVVNCCCHVVMDVHYTGCVVGCCVVVIDCYIVIMLANGIIIDVYIYIY